MSQEMSFLSVSLEPGCFREYITCLKKLSSCSILSLVHCISTIQSLRYYSNTSVYICAMHSSLLLSIAAAIAGTYAAAVSYTAQPLDKSLADAGLQSYANDARLAQGWNQVTRCEVAVSYFLA